MRKGVIIALVLLALTANTGCSPQLIWVPYTAPDGSFTVSFPGTPKITTKTIEAGTYDIKDDEYKCNTDGDILSYRVVVYTYPWAPQTLSRTSAESVLMESLASQDSDEWDILSYRVVVYTYPWAPQTLSRTSAESVLMESLASQDSDEWSLVSSTFGAAGDFYSLDYLLKGINNLSGDYWIGRNFVKDSKRVFMVVALSQTDAPESLDKFLGSFALP